MLINAEIKIRLTLKSLSNITTVHVYGDSIKYQYHVMADICRPKLKIAFPVKQKQL